MKIESIYFKDNTDIKNYIDVIISDGYKYYDVGYGEIEENNNININDYELFDEFERLKKSLNVDAIEIIEVKSTEDSDMYIKLYGNHFVTITFISHYLNNNESAQLLNIVSNNDIDEVFLTCYNEI